MKKERTEEIVDIDLNEARKYLLYLLPKAGEILSKHFRSSKIVSKDKDEIDVVSEADEKTDEFLRKNIGEKFSQTKFLTEETAPDNYLELINAKNLWVIDPLDGTANFLKGNTNFAIAIALVDKGISRLGFVYAPADKKLYWAQEDLPFAFLNNQKIKASKVDDLKKASVGCDFGHEPRGRINVHSWLGKILPVTRAIKTMGCAALDLSRVADGELDGYFHSGLKPWDVAASSLLIKKAGGKITVPDGSGWNVFNPDILATNGLVHDQILNLISKRD